MPSSTWQVPRYFPGDDLSRVYEATRRLGLEGIALNRTTAPYEPGQLSRNTVPRPRRDD